MKQGLSAVMMIEVSITEDEPGFFMATSDDLPELMLGHEDMDFLLRALPEALEGIARRKFQTDLLVTRVTPPAGRPASLHRIPWALVPMDIVAKSRSVAAA